MLANKRLDRSGARKASARPTAGAAATDKGSYVCVVRASRLQVNRTPLGSA